MTRIERAAPSSLQLLIAPLPLYRYHLVIVPMVPASVALWNWGDAPRDASGQRTDLYCWRYNTFGFSCWMDSLNGDWSSGVEAAEADPGAYLLGLRAVRSVSYRLILLSLRWSTPVLLCFRLTSYRYSTAPTLTTYPPPTGAPLLLRHCPC